MPGVKNGCGDQGMPITPIAMGPKLPPSGHQRIAVVAPEHRLLPALEAILARSESHDPKISNKGLSRRWRGDRVLRSNHWTR